MGMGWTSVVSSATSCAVLIRQREPACHSAVSSDHLAKLHNLPRYVLADNFTLDMISRDIFGIQSSRTILLLKAPRPKTLIDYNSTM